MHFGVREHAMGAIVNGLVLSKLRAFGATFLIFSDYMRPALRLAALMELPVFHIFTHDFDRAWRRRPDAPADRATGRACAPFPNMIVLRPADANEVREAYKVILGLTTEPACLVLSRQKLPVFDRDRYAPASGLARGAYVLADAETGKPEVILIASGSEVQLCVERLRNAQARRHCRPGRQHAELGAVRATGPVAIATTCCRRASRRASQSKWAPRSAGTAMPVRPAPSSGCTVSAPPARSAMSWRNSVSFRIRSLQAAKNQIAKSIKNLPKQPDDRKE